MNTTSEYVFPASFAQRSFWFLHQMQPDSSFYNVPIALRLTGRLDTFILARVFDIILERHEPLRTVFRIEEGDPVQIVAQRVHLNSQMQLVDLSNLPFAEADHRAGELIAKEVAAPFDLSRGPVIRIRLLRVTPADHRLLIVIHHIVADVLSCDVLIREFATIYGALHGDKPYDLPPLELQYGDYAIWQRDAFQQDEFRRRMSYWLGQLRPPIPELNLPYDRPRPPIQTYNGASLNVTVPHDLSAAFVEFCKQKHITVFTAALAAYAVLLRRQTGQADLLIGAPVMNRSMRQLESLVGLFLNSVVFRVDVNPSKSFEMLLARVRQTVLEAFDNEVPFEKLVEELRPERDPSRSPFFQTMLTVQNANTTPIVLPEVEVSHLTEVAWNTSKFDLTVFFSQAESGLSVGAEYNTDLFEPTTIEAMLAQLVMVLGAVIRHPERAIDLLDLHSEAAVSANGEPIDRIDATAASARLAPSCGFRPVKD